METLRKQLDAEIDYRMRDETMDEFLSLMTEVELKRNQPLIDYGECGRDVYVVRRGILRSAYFDGLKEQTLAFCLPGTIIISYYAFCRGNPSFSKYEACCPSTVMKIPRVKFLDLADRSHDFAKWMMMLSIYQLMSFERKREIMNGDAGERFEALIINRPEIIRNVSSRVVASYIGITPEYLSKLKRQFAHILNK
ncbi:MAG: Crp/Fnr family transcriptional regulator [Alistipes sp.]|jgi:CRP-like cAMP-binding protein|nr:Crp/Fnr family transcriptional regulator [Alistipes sp.]